MLRMYQLERLAAVFVATVLYAGLPVQRGAAQTPPVDCKSIAPKNGTSCIQTTTITKPVTATDGTTVPQTNYYSTIIDDDYELARAQLGNWNRWQTSISAANESPAQRSTPSPAAALFA
jgi:hypothetical protein